MIWITKVALLLLQRPKAILLACLILLPAILAIRLSVLLTLQSRTVIRLSPKPGNSSFSSASVSESAPKRDLRVALCITGQKERLEISSKLTHILNQRSFTVDLILVLSNATARSVNPLKANNLVDTGAIEEGLELLREKAGAFRYRTLRQPASPLLNPEYLNRLNFDHHRPERRKFRASVHVSQWYAISKCYDEILTQERLNKRQYDFVARLREDLYFVQDFDAPRVLAFLTKKRLDVLAQSCDSWGGVNDKFAAVTRKSAEAYFRGFFDYYYLYPERLNWAKIHNPETYTREVIRSSNLKLLRTVEPLLPGVASSPDGNRTCLKIRPESVACYGAIFKNSSSEIVKATCTYKRGK